MAQSTSDTTSETRSGTTIGTTTEYEGHCHCGAVRFRVRADLTQGAGRCNCSICARVAQLGVLVKPEAFTLIAGQDSLSSYEWGQKVSARQFCRHCGIHCFGRGTLAELGGDFVSVNLNCVDALEPAELKVIYWDGRHNNWEAGPRDRPWPIHGTAS